MTSPQREPHTLHVLSGGAAQAVVRAGGEDFRATTGASVHGTFGGLLLAATGSYLPDPKLATAGIHFVNVLRALGIDEIVAPRLAPYPNGATAMRELAGFA